MRKKLKKEVKEKLMGGLGLIIFLVTIVCLFQYGQARFEKINTGEMILVNQSEMNK